VIEDGGAKSSDPSPSFHRRIRSYVTRAGRISVAQQRALDTLLPVFGVQFQQSLLDFAVLFGREAPVVLEIGFGMGETTAALAALRPDVNFLGIEVHTPGVGALLKEIGEKGLTNLRVIQHDAVDVLEHMIERESLSGIHIFFPDPWHKARHQKRRLIQGPLVALLVEKLIPGGYLHCATDWENYADQIGEVLAAEPGLQLSSERASRDNPLLTRPATKFEARGLRLGHGVWDLTARKAHSTKSPTG
jgi:tRNA (guanine-N7-)-methyltransferase